MFFIHMYMVSMCCEDCKAEKIEKTIQKNQKKTQKNQKQIEKNPKKSKKIEKKSKKNKMFYDFFGVIFRV